MNGKYQGAATKYARLCDFDDHYLNEYSNYKCGTKGIYVFTMACKFKRMDRLSGEATLEIISFPSEKGSTLKEKNSFSKATCCAGNQSESHRKCLPWWKWRKLCHVYPVYLVPIMKTRLFKYILKILSPKNENFQIKSSDIFHSSAQKIDYGYSLEPPRRGGSNEYPQSMFLSRNKKNNVYPCKPQFY